MILPYVMSALHDCLPSSPFLNVMTHIPPTSTPITAELCGGWPSFLDQCKCEVQITCF